MTDAPDVLADVIEAQQHEALVYMKIHQGDMDGFQIQKLSLMGAPRCKSTWGHLGGLKFCPENGYKCPW